MELKLTAVGNTNDQMLYQVSVNEQGEWLYESRAIEHMQGHLEDGEMAQLKNLYDKVSWDHEVLNNPVDPMRDHQVMRLEVDHGNGRKVTYQFSDMMTRTSFELRDLVHYLRHNLATHGDLPGTEGSGSETQHPTWS